MSSKKKSGRSDWSTCQSCKLLITNKDWTKHVLECGRKRGSLRADGMDGSFINESTESFDSDKGRMEYGYIENGVLHILVCPPAENGSEKLLPSGRADLIHLNPETMQICGIHIGRPVLLTNSCTGITFVARAWPVVNFPAASGGLPLVVQESNSLSGADICVESVKCPIIAAKVVRLLCTCRDHLNDSTFSSYLINSLKGKLILPGNRLHVNYFGKPCQLQVMSVTGIDDQEVCYSNAPPSDDQSECRTSNVLDMNNMCINEGMSKSVDYASSSNSKTESHQNASEDSLSRTESEILNISINQNSSNAKYEAEFVKESGLTEEHTTSTPKQAKPTTRKKEMDPNLENLSAALEDLTFRTPESNPVMGKKIVLDHPKIIFKLTLNTELVLLSKLDPSSDMQERQARQGNTVTYDMIGGLKRQLKTIKDTLEVPLTNPDLFTSLGIPPPRGVLLYGPPGVGKTMIARAVAHEAGAHVIIINGPEVMSKYYGESESKLRSIFQEGARKVPCLIFIDELDALCPKRDQVQSELEKRIVATMLTLMDGIGSRQSKGHLMVLGATNRPDAIDPALRRPGRFDKEIEIGVPNSQDRRDLTSVSKVLLQLDAKHTVILQKCLHPIQHTLTPDNIQEAADLAHGYVGADLAAVCKEAAMHAFEQQKDNLTDSQLEGKVHVTSSDLIWALKEVKPSAMREVEIDVPKVYWSDIGGLESIKLKLKQAVEWPIKHPEAFKRMGITPPRGILMYGPPGCSKTLIAKALATESGLNFIAVKGPELFNKWVGESERAIREVFRKARMASPSIVFFDEIDALAVERGNSSSGNNVGDRVLGQLLTEMDGVESLQDVTVVAATNRPDIIDKALMRPGRLDRILYVALPDALTRLEIFQLQFRVIPVHSDVSVDDLVARTDHYSGAEVVAVCREAGLAAMQENFDIETVCSRHFEQALSVVKPRTTPDSIRFYEEYQQNSGFYSI